MSALAAPLAGGLLIGFSSLAMLALLGRITGISGIFASALSGASGNGWRWSFLVGLLVAEPVYRALSLQATPSPSTSGWLVTIIAGFLVGFGTRYAGGCTSGHGVCGIGRLSPRSIAATATFVAAGMLTVFLVRHVVAA